MIGYSKDNVFGDKDAEAWYTAFDRSGEERFSTRIFGDTNLNEINSKGDNITGTTTGDFVELDNGDVAIVYSTSQGRAERDLSLALIKGMKTTAPTLDKEVWLTEMSGNQYVGWGAKVAKFGDSILVAWNTTKKDKDVKWFDPRSDQPIGSSFRLLSLSGTILSTVETQDKPSLYPSQSMRTTPDGKHLIWVSATGNNLTVHLLEIPKIS